MSDHYHPWNDAQSSAPFVWGQLGAMAARTRDMHCTTAVTVPILRIHPAVLAQVAATAAVLFEGWSQDPATARAHEHRPWWHMAIPGEASQPNQPRATGPRRPAPSRRCRAPTRPGRRHTALGRDAR